MGNIQTINHITMPKLAKVGVVLTHDMRGVHQLNRILYAYGVSVIPLNPDAADNKVGIDILMIPDHTGLYPGANAFSNAAYTAVGTKPMCPYAELFRIKSLEYYINREIPVIGVGDGAAMLWNYLGHNIAVLEDTKLGLIPPQTGKVQYKTDGVFVTSFIDDDIIGITDVFDGSIKRILGQVVKSIADEVAAIKYTGTDEDPEGVNVFHL